MLVQFAFIIAFAKVTWSGVSDDLSGNLGNHVNMTLRRPLWDCKSSRLWIVRLRQRNHPCVETLKKMATPTPVFVMSMSWLFQAFSVLIYPQDSMPERHSGRKAQISNITAAKVCYHSFLLRRPRWPPLEDRRRRDKNMPWAKSHAQDDSGSYGRHLVCSLNICLDRIMIVS